MPTEKNTIYRQIAKALDCSYAHVRTTISKAQTGTATQTALNKKIIRLYAQKKQDELDQLLASVTERSTNDYILK